MNQPSATPLEKPPVVPSPEGETAQVYEFTPRPDSPFGPPEGPAPAESGLVARGVDGAKRAAEATKAKLSDAEFRGKLIDASVTAGRVGAKAVQYSRMFEIDPQTGAPRMKPKAAELAKKHPRAATLNAGIHVGKALFKERGTYQKRQKVRKTKN